MGLMEDNEAAQPRERALGRIPRAHKASGETELWRPLWRPSWQPATASNTEESRWKALMEGSRLWQGRRIFWYAQGMQFTLERLLLRAATIFPSWGICCRNWGVHVVCACTQLNLYDYSLR